MADDTLTGAPEDRARNEQLIEDYCVRIAARLAPLLATPTEFIGIVTMTLTHGVAPDGTAGVRVERLDMGIEPDHEACALDVLRRYLDLQLAGRPACGHDHAPKKAGKC